MFVQNYGPVVLQARSLPALVCAGGPELPGGELLQWCAGPPLGAGACAWALSVMVSDGSLGPPGGWPALSAGSSCQLPHGGVSASSRSERSQEVQAGLVAVPSQALRCGLETAAPDGLFHLVVFSWLGSSFPFLAIIYLVYFKRIIEP